MKNQDDLHFFFFCSCRSQSQLWLRSRKSNQIKVSYSWYSIGLQKLTALITVGCHRCKQVYVVPLHIFALFNRSVRSICLENFIIFCIKITMTTDTNRCVTSTHEIHVPVHWLKKFLRPSEAALWSHYLTMGEKVDYSFCIFVYPHGDYKLLYSECPSDFIWWTVDDFNELYFHTYK